MPGPANGVPGDLYVDVVLEEDATFQRDGQDLVARRQISFPEAALGGDVTLELPDGVSVSADVPAGTQPGTVISIRGKGMPRLDGRGRGDLHIVVEVAVPKKLSRRAKKLLQELEEELGESDDKEACVG